MGSRDGPTNGQILNQPPPVDNLSVLATPPPVRPNENKIVGIPIVTVRLFRDGESRYLASSSKDTTIKIWDTIMGTCVRSLTSHTQSVTCIKWGGKNLIYSSSQDRTIKVWRSEDVSTRTLRF